MEKAQRRLAPWQSAAAKWGLRLSIRRARGRRRHFAMTSVITRLFVRLPAANRYPLPPTQITRKMIGAHSATAALLAHFGFGAIGGALYGATARLRGVLPGLWYGSAVWFGSYFGWIPAISVLRPAYSHPASRNGLMLAAHGVWGAVMVLALREIERAAESAFAPGPTRDADTTLRRRS